MGKRGNNEGSIYKRKDGRWEARIILGYKLDGKPRYQSTYHRTKKEAQQHLQGAIYRLSNGLSLLDNTTTVSEWANTWLKSKQASVEEATYLNYRYMMKHIEPSLGKMKLKDLKTIHIQMLINDLHKSGQGRSALEKVKSILYGILQEAEINDMVMRNVCRGVKLPKKEKKQIKDAFSPDEVNQIEQHAGKVDFCDVVAILLNTGLREGEFIALRRQNIDEDNQCIHVTHAAKRTESTSMRLGPPKTPESVRDIPVSPKVMGLLRNLMAKSPSEFVLSTMNGTMLGASNFRKSYKRALERIGVRYLPPHCCRHTYATLLYVAGVDTKTIQTLMGHTDYALTANVYTHVKTTQLQNAVHALESLKQATIQPNAQQDQSAQITQKDGNSPRAIAAGE